MLKPSTSRAMVNLSAYAHNLNIVRQQIPPECGIMAVVKADGYGLGATPIARQAVAAGAAMLGVSTTAEGVALREAGITAPIVVLAQPLDDAFETVLAYDLHPAITTPEAIARFGKLAVKLGQIAKIHIKVDTGMSRQGVAVEQALPLIEYAADSSGVSLEGIATHFPSADVPEDAFTQEQIRVFGALVAEARRKGLPVGKAHAANSAGIMDYPAGHFDLVRPGLMTYGVWPSSSEPPAMPLQPVLQWESWVVLVRDIKAGASVGYGRTYTANRPARLAIVPVGYADGYRFSMAGRAHVLIHGKPCPMRGRPCMDQIMVDVTDLPEVHPGDRVVLVGDDGGARITLQQMADWAGTIPYEMLTGLGTRVTRVYVS